MILELAAFAILVLACIVLMFVKLVKTSGWRLGVLLLPDNGRLLRRLWNATISLILMLIGCTQAQKKGSKEAQTYKRLAIQNFVNLRTSCDYADFVSFTRFILEMYDSPSYSVYIAVHP